MGTWLFALKVGCMSLLALTAAVMVQRAGRPGDRLGAELLIPVTALLLVGVILDDSGYPLLGTSHWSVARCVGTIVLASLPPLAITLVILRQAIPTRPALAGALCGLLAGALGALGYTVACVNDGAGFVAVWYSLAVLLIAALGSALGRRFLRW